MLEPIKPVGHSVISDDDIALDVVQNENWQYFIETVLKTCQTNNGGINNTFELKKYKTYKKFCLKHYNLSANISKFLRSNISVFNEYNKKFTSR